MWTVHSGKKEVPVSHGEEMGRPLLGIASEASFKKGKRKRDAVPAIVSDRDEGIIIAHNLASESLRRTSGSSSVADGYLMQRFSISDVFGRPDEGVWGE